jgi:hypothetical protein
VNQSGPSPALRGAQFLDYFMARLPVSQGVATFYAALKCFCFQYGTFFKSGSFRESVDSNFRQDPYLRLLVKKNRLVGKKPYLVFKKQVGQYPKLGINFPEWEIYPTMRGTISPSQGKSLI